MSVHRATIYSRDYFTKMSADNFFTGESSCYARLMSDTEKYTRKSMENVLKKIGISKVIFTKNQSYVKSQLIFNENTLMILPRILDANYVTNPNETSIITMSGERLVLFPSYNAIDSNCLNIKFGDKIVGDYYKNRNLVILYYNPFPYSLRIRKFQSNIKVVALTLQGKLVVTDNSKELSEMTISRNAQLFSKNIKNSIGKIQDEIETIRNSIDRKGREIIVDYQTIRMKMLTQQTMVGLLSNINGEFEREFLSLKELMFLKEIKLTNDGILLDYGDINVKHASKTYYVGNIMVLVQPEGIRFMNNTTPKNGGYQNIHPHVFNDGRACFGTFSTDVNSLLGSLQLKRLAFLIYQFLTTYNPKSPACQITNFREVKDGPTKS